MEIKSSQTFNPRLLAGLITWQKMSGYTPARQYLVYAGQQNMALAVGQLLPWQIALETL